jgi:TolB protein
MRITVIVVLVALVVVACAPSEPPPSPSADSTVVSPTPTVVSASSSPVSTPTPERALASSGSVAVVRADGSLWLTGTDGGSTILADAQDGVFGFPTWSPDGSRIGAVRTSAAEAAIVVFDAARATGLPIDPRVIFLSPSVRPFYLSWAPDGADVSFLATEGNSLSLRIAPADGSAPLDGTGPGAVIRTGAPLYYDWIDADHLLAHIGAGAEAFLGEIGRDGVPVAPAVERPGTFRSAVVSSDGRFVAFVRAGAGGEDAVVIAARDGSGEQSMPVYGVAALDFGPDGATLASIGAIQPPATPLPIPVGPLRLIDAASGTTRTLIDGTVVSFAWSPDGSTIAAIRVVPVTDGSTVSSASPRASASPAPVDQTEVRLTFVDVASGRIRSDPAVVPGPRYIDAFMTYFDQYALSHRLWAPDSSSILLPQIDAAGTTRVDVFFPDGEPPISIEGEIGFWSP